MVPGDYGSNPGGEEKFFPSLLSFDLMLAIYLSINLLLCIAIFQFKMFHELVQLSGNQ